MVWCLVMQPCAVPLLSGELSGMFENMGGGVVADLRRALGDQMVASMNAAWSQEWHGWSELVGQIAEAQGLGDMAVAFDLAAQYCTEKVRTF